MSTPASRRTLALLTLSALLIGAGGCGGSSAGTATRRAAPLAPVSPHGAGGLATRNTTRLGGSDPVTDAAAVALATHPGLTTATRPAAVVLVNSDDWPAALAASTLAGAPLNAPLLYDAAAGLPAASLQALRAMSPTGDPTVGAQVIAIGAAKPAGYRTRTLSGGDPPALAASIERLASTLRHGPPHQVIIVGQEAPPAFSMPAAGLAAETGAPILLVSSTGIPTPTGAVLRGLKHPTLYVVGPTSAVSAAVAKKLRRYGTVKRIGASEPVANAIAIARFGNGAFGWDLTEPGHGLVFANATRPLDAPAAAVLSASGDYAPLLLLEGPTSVPRALSTYLSNIQPGYTEAPAYRPVHGVYNHGWLIGDELAISTTTQAELDTMLEISPRPTTASPSETEPGTP
jgi:putative cell wall-binding protein